MIESKRGYLLFLACISVLALGSFVHADTSAAAGIHNPSFQDQDVKQSETSFGIKSFFGSSNHDEVQEKPWPLLHKRRDELSDMSKPVAFTLSKSRFLGGDKDDDEHEEEHHELGVHVTYEDLYNILIFLLAASALGAFTQYIGMPALVGEIIAGFLLGPPLAEFVPYAEAMVLVGEIGLVLLLLEAGVDIDIAQLKQTGTRALAIACTGSMLPLLVGLAISMASGSEFKSALALGASFSPTSLGVAANALGSGDMLNTPVGQLIVAACVVDDIIGLVLLAMFEVLVKEDPKIWEYFIPLISAFGFLVVLGWAAVTWVPRTIENVILPKFDEKKRVAVIFSIMTVLLMAFMPLLHYTRASYLTGAFLAGMCFSQIEHAHHTFHEQTHSLLTWLLRIFFSATIGFQVPVRLFSDTYVIGWGFAFWATAVMAKSVLGVFVPKFEDTPKDASFNPYHRDVIVVGLSMTCRGEFSFIIAAFALGEGLFSPEQYAAIVWAVLLSCITSPFMLLHTIKYFNKKQTEYLEENNPMKKKASGKSDGMMSIHYHIKVKSHVSWGMQENFRRVMGDLELVMVDHRTEHHRGLDALVTTDMYVEDSSHRIPVVDIKSQRQSTRAMKISRSSEDLATLGERERSDVETIVEKMRKKEETINKRAEEIRSYMFDCIEQEDATVAVVQWDPWNWESALTAMAMSHGGAKLTSEFFMKMFDEIDDDGSGSVDQDELYEALKAAGMNITKSGLDAMVHMVDEDGDGEIDRGEWKEAIDFFLEQNTDEAPPEQALMRRSSGMTPVPDSSSDEEAAGE